MKKFKNYAKGFTLIELLVVIAIIGILSSVVLVSLNTARNKGKDGRVQAEVAQLRTQFEANFNNSDYGTTLMNVSNVFTADHTKFDSNTQQLISDIITQNSGTLPVYTSGGNGNGYSAGGQVIVVTDKNGASSASATKYMIIAKLPSASGTTANATCLSSSGRVKSSGYTFPADAAAVAAEGAKFAALTDCQ